MTAIGKLHFRSTDDDNGFTEEMLPLHVLDGKGDLIGAYASRRHGVAACRPLPRALGRASRHITNTIANRRDGLPLVGRSIGPQGR